MWYQDSSPNNAHQVTYLIIITSISYVWVPRMAVKSLRRVPPGFHIPSPCQPPESFLGDVVFFSIFIYFQREFTSIEFKAYHIDSLVQTTVSSVH